MSAPALLPDSKVSVDDSGMSPIFQSHVAGFDATFLRRVGLCCLILLGLTAVTPRSAAGQSIKYLINREWRTNLRLSIQEKIAVRRWLLDESVAFHHFNYRLLKDEAAARNEVVLLKRYRKLAIAAANGAWGEPHRDGVRRLLQKVGTAPELEEIMETKYSQIDAGDFEETCFNTVIRPDGHLVDPPRVLCSTAELPVAVAWQQFSDLWVAASAELREQSRISPRSLAALDSALQNWQSTSEPGLERAGGSRRVDAIVYLKRVQEVVHSLRKPRSVVALAGFLRCQGFGLPEGTVGQLLGHILRYQLTVRLGTRAQQLICKAVQMMVSVANSDLLALDERIELLKSQSPAHDTALRQRILKPDNDAHRRRINR